MAQTGPRRESRDGTGFAVEISEGQEVMLMGTWGYRRKVWSTSAMEKRARGIFSYYVPVSGRMVMDQTGKGDRDSEMGRKEKTVGKSTCLAHHLYARKQAGRRVR